MTPGQAAAAFAGLPIAETLANALQTQTELLATAVRDALATPPGGPHGQPWRETGGLQGSIETASDGLTAQVASSHPAAAPQEQGTATIPPRPFLAPAAAALAEPIARAVGKALADTIARRLK